MNNKKYNQTQKRLKREKELQEQAAKTGGKVMTDSQYGRGIHVDRFTFINKDGVTIVEWP